MSNILCLMSSVYKINKGINKPIEFKGLKAQYIAYLAVGLIVLLILFAALYIIGVNMFVCLGITALLGTSLFMAVYHMSDTYGQYGLIKKMAKRNLPVFLKSSSRRLFLNLKASSKNQQP
ncbi:MAG: DUF4133 domain-containing protein [Cyclobacteriaceae bacterium]|nr:DUF4133 domain-containing protein [Cyclobacteriaceae bacterium]